MQVDPGPDPNGSLRLAQQAQRRADHLRDVSLQHDDTAAETPPGHPESDPNRAARGIALGLAICVAGWALAALVWRLLF